MAITLFGVASTPADNGSSATDPTVVTPPANMQAGDLVVMIGHRRAASGTLSISQAGGQSWTTLANNVANTTVVRYFWCVFNGSWTADPSVTMGATLCNLVQMLVFRPDAGYTWQADVALAYTSVATPSSPFTVTRNGITIASNSVAIAGFHTIVAITWSSFTGAGWSKTGLSAQYRNTAGSDSTDSYGYFIGSGATGNVSQNESSAAAGQTAILSFTELASDITVQQESGSAIATGIEETPQAAVTALQEAGSSLAAGTDEVPTIVTSQPITVLQESGSAIAAGNDEIPKADITVLQEAGSSIATGNDEISKAAVTAVQEAGSSIVTGNDEISKAAVTALQEAGSALATGADSVATITAAITVFQETGSALAAGTNENASYPITVSQEAGSALAVGADSTATFAAVVTVNQEAGSAIAVGTNLEASAAVTVTQQAGNSIAAGTNEISIADITVIIQAGSAISTGANEISKAAVLVVTEAGSALFIGANSEASAVNIVGVIFLNLSEIGFRLAVGSNENLTLNSIGNLSLQENEELTIGEPTHILSTV